MKHNQVDELSSTICRADSRLAPNQWETLLHSNAGSHWLDEDLESALICMVGDD